MTRSKQLSFVVTATLTILTATLLTTGLVWLKHQVARDLADNQDEAVTKVPDSLPPLEDSTLLLGLQSEPVTTTSAPVSASSSPSETGPEEAAIAPANFEAP